MPLQAMNDAALHRWTASDGVELAWHELGEGRPVILLHGLFSDAQMNWIKFGHAARIASEGFRVIMPDLRAHGASGKPHEPANYPHGHPRPRPRELVAHLGLEEFDLGGFSLGARTTIDAVGERNAAAPRDPRRRPGLTSSPIGSGAAASSRTPSNASTMPRGDPHWLSIQFMGP